MIVSTLLFATLLFHAPFDGSVEAVIADGAVVGPSVAEGLEYAPGRVGKAVRLSASAKSRLSYARDELFSSRCGAIAFWYRREWPVPERGLPLRCLVSVANEGAAPPFAMRWKNDFLEAFLPNGNRPIVTGWTIPLPGEWVHIAWCWNESEQWMYVNGHEMKPSSDSHSPTKAAVATRDETCGDIAFGAIDIGCLKGSEQADGLIDDFRIYAEPLCADEVRRLVETGGGMPERASAPDWNMRFGGSWTNLYEGLPTERAGEFSPDDLELVEEVRLDSQAAIDHLKSVRRFCSRGDLRFRELGGTPYLENGDKAGDRWALRLQLDAAHPLHVIDIDYPDDDVRTMDVVIQECRPPIGYAMQVGVAAGGEYPNTRRILAHRCIFWTRTNDAALIVMTARKGQRAAASAVRVYRVMSGCLPTAKVSCPFPVEGWRRSMGIFFEDPSIGTEFSLKSVARREPGLSDLIDRTAALMKFTGQNLMAYPGAWYHGLIGDDYNPRAHARDFLSAWYARFDREGLSIMPTLNVNTMPFPHGSVTAKSMSDGSLHSSCLSIHNTGMTNPGTWHNTPPVFNIAHPDTQRYLEGIVDTLISQGAGHQSFKGLCLHVTRHGLLTWGGIESGYNDYCIDAFERASGIRVPCDRRDPLRGKAYFEWIRDNAMEQWLDWRCDVVSAFWGKMARKLLAARPDLKLWFMCFTTSWIAHERALDKDFIARVNREHGIDAKRLGNEIPNLILGQGIVPADYRWRAHKLDAGRRERQLSLPFERQTFDLLSDASFPWVGVYDRYWESPVGRSAKTTLSCDWLSEMPWRVSTVNPSGVHAMRQFVEPLRHHDVLGFSKGGFLVGTYGMEPLLAKFAQSYLALPAVKMSEFFREGNVVGRSVLLGGLVYGYVVNTGAEPVRVSPSLPDGAKDCVHGRPLRGEIALAPYELVSFVK